jgi:hypothetical protein
MTLAGGSDGGPRFSALSAASANVNFRIEGERGVHFSPVIAAPSERGEKRKRISSM